MVVTEERRWGIVAILASFVVLGAVYSVVTPVFEAPDEPWHYAYALHLANGGELPVQSVTQDQPWRQEGSQPPLYYVVGSLLLRPLDLPWDDHFAEYNPHVELGMPSARANVNMLLHGSEEDWPYQGHAMGVHVLRLFSVLLSAGTVWLTYRLALEAFPGKEWVALGAAIINAFTPQFLFIGSSVNNDNAITLLASLALWRLVRVAKGDRRARSLVWLGVVLGLAALSKLSGLGLWALTGAVFLWLGWKDRSARKVVGQAAIVFAVAVLISGWWYARNWTLYGDPTGLGVMLQIVGRRSYVPTLAELLSEAPGLAISYWAIFGWFNVLADRWAYSVLYLLLLTAALGWAIGIARSVSRRKIRIDVGPLVLMLWTAIVILSLGRWTRLTPATQGRLLFPAIGALSSLLAWGIVHWVPSRWCRAQVGLMAGILLMVAAVLPFRVIAPAYAGPEHLRLSDVPSSAQPVMAEYGGLVRLVACELDRSSVREDEVVRVSLYWHALERMDEQYSVFIHLVDPDGRVLGQVDSYPGGGLYPTRQWSIGDVVEDVHWLWVRSRLETPILAEVEVGLYVLSEYRNLPITDAQGRSIGRVVAGRIKVAPPVLPTYEISNPAYYDLGGEIALVGYEILDPSVAPGERIGLSLYWQSLSPASADYTVFVHLLDGDGQRWSQSDKIPQKGYSTLFWDPDEIVFDQCEIPIPLDAPAGEYHLSVGLYRADTMQRLLVRSEGQSDYADHIVLDEPLNVVKGE
jgi:4-amino-4-deoxy-L-arabinose transferase-like glycosyltransferase